MARGLVVLFAVVTLASACSESATRRRATSTSVPTSVVAPVTTRPVSAGLPEGVEVKDLTWISETHGWALASIPDCSEPECTGVLTTTDGGGSWSRVGSPDGPLNGVAHLRFATASLGYAFDPALMVTTDGGQTWALQPGRAVGALETDGHDVIRLSYGDTGCPGPCGWTIDRAVVGSGDWQRLPAPAPSSQGVAAQLVRQGHDNVYAAFFGNPAGGAGNAATSLIVSHDDGNSWISHPDPCAAASGGENDSVAIAAAPGDVVAALCIRRGAEQPIASVVVSTDRAATFGPHRRVTSGSYPGVIAATTSADLLVATTSTRGNGTSRYEVDVSHDAGRTWTTAVSDVEDIGGLRTSAAFLGFESATVGRWVGYPRTIWTTTNGGDHWTANTFR